MILLTMKIIFFFYCVAIEYCDGDITMTTTTMVMKSSTHFVALSVKINLILTVVP